MALLTKNMLTAAAAALALAACTSPPSTRQPGAPDDRARPGAQAIEKLLTDAGRGGPPSSSERRLDAAAMALELDQTALLKEILAGVRAPYYNQRTTMDFTLLKAELALIEGDPRTAAALLNDARFMDLSFSTDQQARVGDLRSRAYAAGGSYLASARELIFIDKLVNDAERERYHDRLFQTLLRLDESTLRKQAERSLTSDIRGWLSLAALSKRYEHDPARQLNELNNWMKVWPNHPAASRVPGILARLSRIVSEQPKHVALLLPLQGELGRFGRAVRDGFIAAHFQRSPNTELSIYDTSQKDAATLVDLAQSRGAELIVGPLDRDRVTELAGRPLPVPVIGLNRTLDGSTNNNLYQFGLAPEDESIQVAERVILESRFKGLVIAPDNDWGDRNLQAFTDAFANLGGVVVDSARFASQRDYSEMVKSLLDVDASEARAEALRQVIGEWFQFTARRRQDIDFVFLLANPRQSRGINPTLAYFYAEDIPVYATSHVHETGESRIDVIDMNGIRFCDIPWKLTGADAMQNDIQNTWGEAKGQLAPFYALGVDAHRLYPRLRQIKGDERIYGATGALTLDEGNVVRRALSWAQFRDGEVEPAPMILDVAAGN